MTFYQILATIAVIIFLVYTVFNIVYLVDLRRTSVALRQFILRTEENLNPALAELRLTLQDIRKVTKDLSALSERLRAAAGTIITIEKTIQGLYAYYREGFAETANTNIAALKAGVKAGVANFIKSMKSKKEGSA